MTRSVRGRSRPRSSITMATRGLSRISTGADVAKRSQAGCCPDGVLVSGRGGSIAVWIDGGSAGAPVCAGVSELAEGATEGRLVVVPPPLSVLGGRETATVAVPPPGGGAVSQPTTAATNATHKAA